MNKITINVGKQVKLDQAIRERTKEMFGVEIPSNRPIFYGTIVIEENNQERKGSEIK